MKYRIVETVGGKFYVEYRRVGFFFPSWFRDPAEYTVREIAERRLNRLKDEHNSMEIKKVHKC